MWGKSLGDTCVFFTFKLDLIFSCMSVFSQHGKSVGTLLLFFISFQFLYGQAESHRPDSWVPDNSLYRVEHSNGYTMLSGAFSYVGKYSGGAVYTDVATGKNIDETMPKTNGWISDIVSDGSGGWYLAGFFDTVDTVKVKNLVHIKSDKTVDRTWKPNPDNAPSVLKVEGTTLYVGGYFGEIAGQSRNNLASFNTSTGALNAWAPNPNSYVQDIAISGSTLIIGGSFTQIGATVRTRLASFDITTGELTTWAPSVNAGVYRLALDGAGIFISGDFTSAGASSRTGIARIDLSTGLATAPVITLNSGGYIYDMKVNGGNLFLAGYFTSVNGVARFHLASLNIGTNAVNALNVNLLDSDYVTRIALDGSTLYVTGYFYAISGSPRRNAATVNATTGAILNWNPSPEGPANAILPGPNGVWLGGYMWTAGIQEYNGFLLIEEATNELWPFHIDIDGIVSTMAIKDNVVYIGGQFTSVNKSQRANLAALDLRTGEVLAWDPGVYGLSITDRSAHVNSIKIKDNLLFVGGRFYAVNSMATVRPGLAAINLTTGAATNWNPVVGDGKTISQYVNSIDILGNTLYAGGNFFQLDGSTSRSNLAAIDTESANILAWDPNSSGEVHRVRANTSTVYVVGNFPNGIGGTLRPYGVAAVNATTGSVTPWNPTFDGSVNDLALQGNSLFVGGYFYTVENENRPGLASFNTVTGTLNDWTPDINDDGEGGYNINSLSASTSRLFVSGGFRLLGNEVRPYYGEYDLCAGKPEIVLNGNTFSTTATGDLQWYAFGQPVPGATGQTFEVSPIEYGVYAVSVTEFGCESFSDEAIYAVTALETNDPLISVYPNPVQDQLYFDVHTSNTLDVTLMDMMGRVLLTERNITAHPLSFSEYKPGTYVLIVQTGGMRYVRKIMKLR